MMSNSNSSFVVRIPVGVTVSTGVSVTTVSYVLAKRRDVNISKPTWERVHREARRLNQEFRNQNRATNVLSFATGDVVLCHPVIRREARAQGKSVRAHYAHLVVHGVLHLRGYAHEKKRDAARMEAREIAILRNIGMRNPYAIE